MVSTKVPDGGSLKPRQTISIEIKGPFDANPSLTYQSTSNGNTIVVGEAGETPQSETTPGDNYTTFDNQSIDTTAKPEKPEEPKKTLAQLKKEKLRFKHAKLPPLEGINPLDIRYKTIKEVPVVEVEGGFEINDEFLENVHQIWYAPPETTLQREEWVFFYEPRVKEKEDSLRDLVPVPTDELFVRLQSSQNNFGYLDEYDLGFLGKQTGEGQYQLGRSAKPDSNGNYKLYVFGKNKVLANVCGKSDVIRLKPVSTTELSDADKTKIVAGCQLSDIEYCFTSDRTHRMFVTSNLDTIDDCTNKLEGFGPWADPGIFATPARATEITDALDSAVSEARAARRKSWAGLGFGAASTGLFAALLYNAITTKNLMKENMGGDKDPAKFLEDHTKKAKAKGYSSYVQFEGENDLRRMIRTTLTDSMRNILVSGEAGSGKGITVMEFFHRIATGQIPHLKDYKLFSFNAEAFAGEGAKFVGEFEKTLDALLKKAQSEPTIIYIEEAQVLKGMGSTTGKPSDILESLKRHMSKEGSKLILIFDTNQPDIFLQDPAFEGRLLEVEKEPPSYKRARQIFEQVYDSAYKGFTLSDGAKHAFIHVAGTHARGRIAGAIFWLKHVVADMELDGKTTGEITEADVIKFFAEEFKTTPETIRAFIELSKAGEAAGMRPENINKILKELRKGKATAETINEVTESIKKGPAGKGGKSGPGGASGPGSEPPSTPPVDEGSSESRSAESDSVDPKDRRNRTMLMIDLEETPRHRFGQALEKVGGMAAIGGLLSGIAALEHYDIISHKQAQTLHYAIISGVVIVDAGFIATLGFGMPGAVGGHYLGSKAASATGIAGLEEGSLGNTISGIFGGIAGFEASVYAASRTPYLKTLFKGVHAWSEGHHQAAAQGLRYAGNQAMNGIGSAGMAIENAIASAANQARLGLQIFGSQAAGALRSVAASGSNLVSSIGPRLAQIGPRLGQMGRQLAPGLPMMGPAMLALRLAGAGAAAGGGTATVTTAVGTTAITFTGTAAVAAGTAAVGAGLALGAAIHYSGAGKVIGTDALGEAIGDFVYRDVQRVKAGYQVAKQAVIDWFSL